MPKYPFIAVRQLPSLMGMVEHCFKCQIDHLLHSLTGGYTLQVTCLQALVKTGQDHPLELAMIKIFLTQQSLHPTSQMLILGTCLGNKVSLKDASIGNNNNNSISHQ